MSARVLPTKLVAITTLLNVIGNLGLWAAVVAYRISHGDSMQSVNFNAGCMKIGYALLIINALAFVMLLYMAARSHQWLWLIAAILLLAGLAYEAIFIWFMYGVALMAPMGS